MPHVRLTVEYDGSGFHGWQVQPDRRTVQGEMETAASRLLGGAVRVAGAGRTDAGTHALGQVAALHVTDAWSAERFADALGAVLPDDIAIRDADEVADSFDPRRNASRREYRYRLSGRESALERLRRWHVRGALDLVAMRQAAEGLIGDHDFTPFTVNASEIPDRRVRLETAEVQEAGEEIMMVFAAHHFLNRMVRLMVGTVVDVGRGRFDPGATSRALADGDRRWVGTAAPAHGLYLARVEYGRPDIATGAPGSSNYIQGDRA